MSDEESKRGRGRPRRADADALILRTAGELLHESGHAAFSIDTVAERTGIAKTTIYRRWPTRALLVASVLESTIPSGDESVRAILLEIVAAMRLLGNGDPAALEVLLPFTASRHERLTAIGTDEIVADALIGALVVRFATGRGSIEVPYVDALASQSFAATRPARAADPDTKPTPSSSGTSQPRGR